MTDEQILAVYHLTKDERVSHSSVTNYTRVRPHVSVMFASGVTSEEAIEVMQEVFSYRTFLGTHLKGQYSDSSRDIFFHVADEQIKED